MRILVTGGAGFIGSHVVDAYIAAGHHVVIVDNLATGRRENLNPHATFYEVDICDAELLAQVFEQEQPEVVNHHAAQIDVRRSVADPLYDAQVNVIGTLTLLEQARAHNVQRVIFISSGGAIYGEPEHLGCDEEHPIAPLSPYGASKYAVEVYLSVYRTTYGMETAILRYANVYGPRQDPHGEAGVVAIFTGKMLAGATPTIYGSGEQTRDFVYVGDCARANLKVLTQGSGRAYNIGTGEETSINQLAAVMKEVTGYAGEILYAPEKTGDVFRIYSDATRAHEELGWQAEVDLHEGLTRTVAYFREQEEA